jgi:hypothetical protein
VVLELLSDQVVERLSCLQIADEGKSLRDLLGGYYDEPVEVQEMCKLDVTTREFDVFSEVENDNVKESVNIIESHGTAVSAIELPHTEVELDDSRFESPKRTVRTSLSNSPQTDKLDMDPKFFR